MLNGPDLRKGHVMKVAESAASLFHSSDLAERALHRRAVEAINWGMPAVNLDLMLQAMIGSAKGKSNQIAYWSRLPDWKIQTLTPNPDVIYLKPFFNTKDVGPMVLEIPPANGGSITGLLIPLAPALQPGRPRAQWARIAVRVAGSWIAASGLLVLGWAVRAR